MAQRKLTILLLIALTLPTLVTLSATPLADAHHSGIRNADAFRSRPVAYNTTGVSGSGLSANDLWRDGTTTWGDYASVSNSASQSSSACNAASNPYGGANNGRQDIIFTDNASYHPLANQSNALNHTQTRYLDNLYVLGDIPSSGSTSACGYFYGLTLNNQTWPVTITETYLGKCNGIGGGNAANGNRQQACTLTFTDQGFQGIRVYVQSAYSTYAPSVNFDEIQGNGVDDTPPTQQPIVTTSANGCTINVAWTLTSDTTTYVLYQGDAPGYDYHTLTPIATIASPGAGYTTGTLASGKTYYYQVISQNVDGFGPPSNITAGTAGVCDGTGLGVIGSDGHMGPNLLTHYQTTSRYVNTGQWSITSNGGGYTFGCTDVGEVGNMYLPCATDGVESSYINLYSVSTYTRGAAQTTCSAGGYVEWTWPTAQSLQTTWAQVTPYNDYGGGNSSLCASEWYQDAASGQWTQLNVWPGLQNNTKTNLWYNTSVPVSSKGFRLYIGDQGTGGSLARGGFIVHEADAFDYNATYYTMQSSLRDLAAGYSEKVTGSWSYGTYYTKNFTLYNGVWKIVAPVPYDTTTGRLYNWQFNALGAGWSSSTDTIGPRLPSWANAQAGPACAVSIYTITITGGARQFNMSAIGVNSGTVFCRVTGTSFMPSPYQPASQGYKIQADWTQRTCGVVSCGSGETAGEYYQGSGFPWSPMIDTDFSDATVINEANFTPGAIVFNTGAQGQTATVSLASYPYQFFGNGLFIALGQDEPDTFTYSSTNYEITLNGRPASVVHNSYFAGYQVAIFYLDDQAHRRGLANHDGNTAQGNRRVHGDTFESYQITILKGFDPSKPVRAMRSFGFEGHGGLTCRDFCSANVDLSAFKTPPENQNHVNFTVLNARNSPIAGVRVTNNATGSFAFTDTLGKVAFMDVYFDTKYTFALSGYYQKCVGYEFQTLQGQQLSTVEGACGLSSAYPSIRAQNLEYTVILYELPGVDTNTTTTFNEVPVEVVTKPVQGIVFRGNFTRIVPDQVSIQVQRNVSEDLKITVFRFDPRTGVLNRVTDPLAWSASSNANPLLVTYPGGRSTTNDDEGAYHIMVQRGNTYVTGASFKILADWTHLNAIVTPGDVPQSVGDDLAQQVTTDQQQATEAAHQEALAHAAGSVDTGSALAQAVIIVPVILLLLFVGLLIRNLG